MSMGSPLPAPTLSVKLVPPAIGPSYLARPRLQALLDEVTRKTPYRGPSRTGLWEVHSPGFLGGCRERGMVLPRS